MSNINSVAANDSTLLSVDQVLSAGFASQLNNLIKQQLKPLARDIDQKGLYPVSFLQQIGAIHAYGQQLNGHTDLASSIAVIAKIAETCGSTAFAAWCQAACVWYLEQTSNQAAKRFLADLASGKILAGTGMSNAVKHLAGIERINIQAKRTDNGYTVKGALPWVSNLGADHLLIVAAHVEDGGYIMFILPPNTAGVSLRHCPDFSGINGTGTYNVQIKNAWVPAENILADEAQFESYINKIKPGFLLSQVGIALGLIKASIDAIASSNKRLQHVNRYLDNQHDALAAEYASLQDKTLQLAQAEPQILLLDALRLRAQASELALKATQSAALHAGAAGYILQSPVQRRLREALFVAIVTPALKHLRKEIYALEQAA